MKPLLVYSLPALLLGLALGFLGAGGSEAPQGKADRADGARDRGASDDRAELARMCAREASRVCAGAGRGARAGSPAAEARPADESDVDDLRARLTDLEATALEHGLWSRGVGFKARHLLRGLPAEDGAALRRRLDAAAKEGRLDIQPGTWLPTP